MQTQSYDEFDAFAAAVGHVESRMLYRNPERREWRLASVDLGRLSLQCAELGSGNIAQGQMQADGCIIYAPLTPATEYVANGATVATDSFAILDPGTEFCISTKVAHDWAGIFLPNHVLSAVDDLEGPRLENPTVRVTPANWRDAVRFRAAFRNIMTAATASSEFESSPAARSADAWLLEIATSVLGRRSVAERPGRPRVPRDQVIRRCNELLEEKSGWPVRVEDLVAAAQVRPRTLQRIFQEYYGIAPKRFVQFRQLHQVNRALRAAEPDAKSVTDVLVENGVWEFGRFAARYRQMFGELPSETLRARPGRRA